MATTTTSIEFAQGQLDMPAPVTDRRGGYAGEMARTQADLVAAEARAAERLQLPITNAADDRLAAIWERGEQIANDEGFCSEYDRLVEAIGGTPRERDFRVTLSVTLTQRVRVSVSARTTDEAEDLAIEAYTVEDVIESLRDDNYVADSIDAEATDCERE